MKPKKMFSIQLFIVTFMFNGMWITASYFIARQGLRSEDSIMLFFGLGGGITIFLWLIVTLLSNQLVPSQQNALSNEADILKDSQADMAQEKNAAASASQVSAVQMLAILQREGRLIDFLQEDLSLYDDSQIGAAVRSVHEGCGRALTEHLELKPVFSEKEGSEVTIPPNFDAHAIRLLGNITGDPPFKGALRHRGWQVTSIELPQKLQLQQENMILAAAEVELSD